jgi:hypothetical protein
MNQGCSLWVFTVIVPQKPQRPSQGGKIKNKLCIFKLGCA